MDSKLAIITSHPIQYQTPIFKELSRLGEIEFCVYFGSTHGISPESEDIGFGRRFAWDLPLLEGYPHCFPNGDKFNHHSRKSWLLDIQDAGAIAAKDGITQILLMVSWSMILFWRILGLSRRGNIPLIYRGETVSAHWRQSTWWDRTQGLLKSRVKKAIYPLFLKKIDLFITVGTLPERFLLEHGVNPSRFLRAPYCVDNEFFSQGVEQWKKSGELLSLRKELDIPPEAKVILYTGKFIPRKRPKDLIKAVKQLPKDLNAFLIMVGDGILMKEVQKEADGDNRIRLVGFQNQRDIVKYYALSDIFVLPSDYETWGLSVNEAMASSLPVVVSERCTSAPDLVIAGKTGYTFPPGNVELLTDRLKSLLSDKDLRLEMSHNARDRIKQFSIERTARTIIEASHKFNGLHTRQYNRME